MAATERRRGRRHGRRSGPGARAAAVAVVTAVAVAGLRALAMGGEQVPEGSPDGAGSAASRTQELRTAEGNRLVASGRLAVEVPEQWPDDALECNGEPRESTVVTTVLSDRAAVCDVGFWRAPGDVGVALGEVTQQVGRFPSASGVDAEAPLREVSVPGGEIERGESCSGDETFAACRIQLRLGGDQEGDGMLLTVTARSAESGLRRLRQIADTARVLRHHAAVPARCASAPGVLGSRYALDRCAYQLRTAGLVPRPRPYEASGQVASRPMPGAFLPVGSSVEIWVRARG